MEFNKFDELKIQKTNYNMKRKENFLDQKIGEMAIYIINWL